MLWCPYPDCKRSKERGDKPLSSAREDHYNNHLRNVHGEHIPKKETKKQKASKRGNEGQSKAS